MTRVSCCEAFRRTIDELGVEGDDAAKAEDYVIETMGQSKIEVFTSSLTSAHTMPTMRSSATSSTAATEVGVSEVPGARATIESSRVAASPWR